MFQGSTDCDITENGARQLDALAERMLEFPFQALILARFSAP